MSFLKLNKLVITKEGESVYSEDFHNGVNIIRGDNSSGKSTISNFIFFALGGEFTDWLPEARSCDFVFAELSINEVVLTVKREISDISRRPMQIFPGELKKAIESNYEGWNIYPYSKSEKTESFSQVLFKALGFPEVSTDNQESITINQVLRLLYVDQLSALDSLMRNEDFDSPLIRSAIGNLLLGTYDDELLSLQKSLRQKEREFGDIKKQVRALEDVFLNSPFDFDKDKVTKHIDEKKEQLDKILKALEDPDTISNSSKPSDIKKDLKENQNKLVDIKKLYSMKLSNLQKEITGIIDNKEFLEVLNSKLAAIKESINSREILGSFPLQYCPVCLEKLESVNDNHCKLCKHEVTEDAGKSKLFRMQLEVEMQIKESTAILLGKEKSASELEKELKQIEQTLKLAQRDYDTFVNRSRSSTENKFDKLLEKKGRLLGDIEFLDKQLQLVNSYGEYKNQLFALENSISRLKDEISKLEQSQRKKATVAYSKIQYYALELLKGDGAYEEKFQDGKKITLDFKKNSFYLDDRNRFSASSMVLLKNCVRFAIFFASLELDYFRYPKFLICDNVEDKGMVELRSKNFQRNVVQIANSEQFEDKQFQIIMTTSMVAEDLNIPEYTVGPYYNGERKTLELNKSFF